MPTDADIREAGGKLRALLEWAKENQPDYLVVVPKQQEVIARYQPLFAPENIPNITEDEFAGFLRFENNQHWWFPPFHIPSICADMDHLREALAILVDESRPIKERLDLLISPSGSPMVPYMSRAIITAILIVIAPDKYGVWNGTSEGSLKSLGLFPDIPGSALFSERYLAFNDVLKRLAEETGVDLWTLDYLHYAIREYDRVHDGEDGAGSGEREIIDAGGHIRFGLEQHLHEFMRDNWAGLDIASEWNLLEKDGEIVGFEYNTGKVGSIDLLAKHRTEPRWLVIELKRNQSSDQTVGQVLRYMGWVEEELAEAGDTVEGMIIAHSSDERIRYALKNTNNVGLQLYEIDFQLRDPDVTSEVN